MDKLGTIAFSPDIFMKSNIGLWAFELDEGSEPRMYVDEAMLKLIGLEEQVSPEETYHAWYDHIDSDHYDEVTASVEKMTAGIHAEVQYPWHHPNGEVWIVRCGGVRNYSYTKGIRIEGTHQNVTEIMHYERRGLSDLLASLSDNFLQVYLLNPYTGSFSSYLGNAFDGDEDRDFSNVNFYQDVAERSSSIVHPDDKPLIDKVYTRDYLISVLESQKTTEFVVRWISENDGEYIYMKNRLVPYVDEGGNKKLIIGVLDVTEEIVAEKTLGEKNAYLEHFLKSFKSAYIVDLKKDTFEILNMEHEFQHIFKQDGGKAEMNEFIENHVHPDDRELIKKMSDSSKIREILKTNDEISFTIREIFDDVEKTMRVHIMRGADFSRAAVGFIDITDEIAKERQYSQQLEKANKAKSSFLFNMSHDIRTPMNAIIGFTGMAISHIDDKAKALECLDKVRVSSKHLLALINDVLDMARIESGKVQCQYTPACVTQEAEQLMEMVRETTNKNVSITSDFTNIEHDYVWADRLHVNRIVTNIISNSVKYTPDGGGIKYSIKEKPTSCENHYSYDFIIEDNGIGMSEEFKEHIFDAFEREKNSTISGIQGTGLGMAITKNLVEILGGTINIESKPGKGTKVTINLNMEAASPDGLVKDEAEDMECADFKGKRVLLVDDNELNREIAIDLLEDIGLTVEIAVDGKQAVDKYKQLIDEKAIEYYDLVFMDIQMPIMDGYEATKVIRALTRNCGHRIPIVAMTANAFEEDKRASIEAGMDAHLSKPVDVKEIVKVLKRFIEGA